METNHLHEYAVLANMRSFTLAARKLNLTQSALSKHIASLEREFGCDLFVRSGKGVEMPQAGKVLYDDARRVEGMLARMRRNIQNSSSEAASDGVFDIGGSDSDVLVRKGCARIAEKYRLSATEQSALVLYLEEQGFDAIEHELGIERDEVAMLLGSIYRKIGASDKQGALYAIQSNSE